MKILITRRTTKPVIRSFFKRDVKSFPNCRYLWLLLVSCCWLSLSAEAKNRPRSFVLSGTVFNEKNEVLPGANISVVGATKGTVSDVYGKFLIEVESENDSIAVTFVGYKSQRLRVGSLGGRKDLSIKLEPDTEGQKLNETIVVGFGSQKKKSVLGSISTVKVSELAQTATPSLSNAIGGRIPGVITRQVSGEPGYDAANVFVRGLGTFTGNRTPLVLVDGVERSMNLINTQEVESFSVLKDATATAVYGIKGANGVILITTKRGVAGKPKVSFRTENARVTPLRLPEFVNSYEYATLANEATTRGGRPAPFYTPEQVQKYKDHSDPYLYPDVDWVPVVLKKNTFQSINNLSVTGGNDIFKYYTNVGYTVQQGIYHEDKSVLYPTNVSFKRYNFTSNIDINLTKNFSVALNIRGVTSSGNYPGAGAFEIMEALTLTPNNAYPVKNPNGSIPGSGTFLGENPYTKTTQRGYTKEYRSNVQTSLDPRWDLGSVVKGLVVRGKFAYDAYNLQASIRPKQPGSYQYRGKNTSGGDSMVLIQPETALGYRTYSDAYSTYYLESAISYDRTFGNHTVGGLLVGNMREYIYHTAPSSIGNIPQRRMGLATRLSYDYDGRYFAEFDAGFNGSENFPPGKRYGFFPSGSVGWIASREKFWNIDAINFLKLRFSYGQVGNDQVSDKRYLYLTTINKSANNYGFGEGMGAISGAFAEALIGNEDLSWEVSTDANLGLEMELLRNRLVVNVEVFKRHRTGILISLAQIPISAGYPGDIIPFANLGVVDNKGVEANLEFRNRTSGGFYYSFQTNFTYTRNRILEDGTPHREMPYQNSRGQAIDRPFGYVALGIFQNQEQIDKSPDQTFFQPVIRPGDIQFKDMNGDNRIDANDRTYIGYARTPEIMYGFGGTVAYKGVEFSVFFAGAANTDIMMNGRSSWAFADGVGIYNVYKDYYNNRFIPGAPDNSGARYPAVLDVKSPNNFNTNTLWLRNGNYLRVKSAELAYNLPKHIAQRLLMNTAKVFVNGMNLGIWDHVKIVNPEDNNANPNYPLTQTINFGLQVTF